MTNFIQVGAAQALDNFLDPSVISLLAQIYMHHVVVLFSISVRCSSTSFVPLWEKVQLEVFVFSDPDQLSKQVELLCDRILFLCVFGLFSADFCGFLLGFSFVDFDRFDFFVLLAAQFPGDRQRGAICCIDIGAKVRLGEDRSPVNRRGRGRMSSPLG